MIEEGAVTGLVLGEPSFAAPFAALKEHDVKWRVLTARAGDACMLRLHIDDAGAARRALVSGGLISLGRTRARGEVFVGYDERRDLWLRVEVTPGLEADRGPRLQRASATGRSARRRGWGAARAAAAGRGLSLALVAPDGAGKSTLAAGLRDALPVPVRVVYMGMRDDLGRRSGRWMLPRLARHWRRYLEGRYHVARGRVVIFDRYSYDALLPGPRAHDRLRRARRWIFSHALPPPHLGVVLDAPGEVMFRRKGEHDVASLELRRGHYLRLAARIPRLVVVDASRPPEDVRRDVSRLMWQAWKRHRSAGGASAPVGHSTVSTRSSGR